MYNPNTILKYFNYSILKSIYITEFIQIKYMHHAYLFIDFFH